MKEKTNKAQGAKDGKAAKDGKGARVAAAAWRVGDKAVSLTNKVREKVNVKAAGIALGSTASFIAKPCLQFYDGIREGFNKKTPPARD